jgi:hypothetical protein
MLHDNMFDCRNHKGITQFEKRLPKNVHVMPGKDAILRLLNMCLRKYKA